MSTASLAKEVGRLRALARRKDRPAIPEDRVEFARAIGIEPDPWQEELLRSYSPRVLLNASRQSGKSTVVGILATHTALQEPDSLVLLLSPTLRQSGELFKKCLAVYRSLDRPVPPESETALTLSLENGSRIVSLPGKEQTIRGYSGVGLLAIDEAARVPGDSWPCLRPSATVGGGTRRGVLRSCGSAMKFRPRRSRAFRPPSWKRSGGPWESGGSNKSTCAAFWTPRPKRSGEKTLIGHSRRRSSHGCWTIGVDVGQRRDPTAIAVVESEWRERLGDGDVHHLTRHVERLPLGTPYPRVAERVSEVVSGVKGRTGGMGSTLYLDATGVGTPIVDVLKAAGVGNLARLVPVYFTHGDRGTLVEGEVRLGKAWLVSRMQTLLQGGLLHLPKTAEALGRELLDYEIRVTEDANDRYGAFKVGIHDDLVTALGLATQEDRAHTASLARSGGGPFGTPSEAPFKHDTFENLW